jgi:hypothetical protein
MKVYLRRPQEKIVKRTLFKEVIAADDVGYIDAYQQFLVHVGVTSHTPRIYFS